ncbi:MAG: hypothetical protein ACLGG0_04535 [Bacteriovoracia bacterium]
MLESLITTLDKFTPEILVILSGLLVITTTLFLWLWFANRRTYNLLKHQLPASVVKTYLDSVIQNSNSLKSALFRGNDGDVSFSSMPSSMPLVGGGESLAIASSGNSSGQEAALREQLQQKLAELAALQSQLAAANSIKKELESGLAGAQARIKELEALLAQSGKAVPAASGNDAAIKAELQKITKERDELRDRLKEYEIIEDDLANLKRLQQENQQLKRALGQDPTDSSPAAAAPVAPVAAPPKVASPKGQDPLAGAADLFDEVPVEDAPTPESEVAEEAVEAAAPEEVAASSEESTTAELEEFLTGGSEAEAPKEVAMGGSEKDAPAPKAEPTGNEKTPEDLLSEFEKMLG